MLSGLTIIRNGFECGYTFVETIQTLLAICDEVIICEGYSTDNTYEIITDIFKEAIENNKIKIYRDEWQISSSGVEFARMTNVGLSRCSGDYIFYLQADELIHENDFDKIKELIKEKPQSIDFKIIHLRYSIKKAIIDHDFNKAIRVIKNTSNISSIDDGYSFRGDIHPQINSDITIYHAGYVFLINILNKMINHAKTFYVDNENYIDRATIAKQLLEQINAGKTININDAHQALEPFYHIGEHHAPIPKLLIRHIDQVRYVIETSL